jgi:hypothetical protein
MIDAERMQHRYARLAGLMLLVVLGLSIVGLALTSLIAGDGTFDERAQRIIASEGLYRFGLVCALGGSLATIVLAMSFYVAVRPRDGNLAMMALLFRTGESVIGALGIVLAFATLSAVRATSAVDPNQVGALADLLSASPTAEVAAIFFSVGSTIFFYVLLGSTYIPKALAAWGCFASALYAVMWITRLLIPESSGLVVVGSLPILVAELSTGLWLLLKGIETQPAN